MSLVFKQIIWVLDFPCRWLEKTLNDVISIGAIVLKTLSKTVDERKRRRTEYEESVVSLKEAVDTVFVRKSLFTMIVFCYFVCVSVFA